MLSELSGSFASMDEETRRMLAELLEVRNEYLNQLVALNGLRLKALHNPTPENEEAVNDFASAVLAPLSARNNELTMGLVKDAIDIEGIQKMLPMVLATMTQYFNLPLILTVLNIDPNAAEKTIAQMSAYFKTGM